MDPQILKWLKTHKHLPAFMRDFHDQKDLFKAIQERYGDHPDYPDWIRAQCYTIDRFLWFMAQHGYTLQRSHTRLPFYNVHATVKAAREAARQACVAAINSILKPEG